MGVNHGGGLLAGNAIHRVRFALAVDRGDYPATVLDAHRVFHFFPGFGRFLCQFFVRDGIFPDLLGKNGALSRT
jgi:hypothetical protein